jgi:hypothetical protein
MQCDRERERHGDEQPSEGTHASGPGPTGTYAEDDDCGRHEHAHGRIDEDERHLVDDTIAARPRTFV